MKKFYIRLIALALAVAMTLPLVTPVSADSPKVVGYVTGSAQGGYGVQPEASLGGTVKLLSDGTVVGNWYVHYYKSNLVGDWLDNTEWKCDEFDGMYFPDAHTAIFWGTFTCINNSQKIKGMRSNIVTFQITDNGEPGIGQDTWWLMTLPAPIPVEHGNFQVYYAGNP